MSYWIEEAICKKIVDGENFIGLVTGKTGSGKSWACLSIGQVAQRIFKKKFNLNSKFDLTHVCSSIDELMDLYDQLNPGDIVVYEEAGVSANAKKHQSKDNIDFSEILQIFRYKQIVFLMNVPLKLFVDRQGRSLIHAHFQVVAKNKQKKVTWVKPYLIETAEIDDKIKVYRKWLRRRYVNRYGFVIEQPIKILELSAPKDGFGEQYDNKARQFKDAMVYDMKQRRKEKKRKSRHPIDQEVILQLRNNGKKYDEIAEILNCSTKTIQRAFKMPKTGINGQ